MSFIATPRWLQLVAPATACLRFGVLATIAVAGFLGFEIGPAVIFAAAAVAVVYAALYTATALGRMRPPPLAYGVIADGLLLGVLLSGAGVLRGTVAFLSLPVLATAQISGGIALSLVAAVATAAAWGVGTLAGTPTLVWPASKLAAVAGASHFHTILQVETKYRGVSASSGIPLPTEMVALIMLSLICVASAVALIRAWRERRRALESCTHAEALETIVDRFLTKAPAEEFWRTVAQAGVSITGARVYAARVENNRVLLCASTGPVPGGEIDQTAEWILRNLRVPMTDERNLVVRSIHQQAEEESGDILDLCVGAERGVAPDVLEKLRETWPVALICVPVGGSEKSGALIGIAPQITESIRAGLRAVAQRLALVLRVGKEDPGPPLTQLPTSLPA